MTVATTLGLTSAPTTHTRLLGWVADVAALEGDTDATETPIGYVPAPDAIDTSGLGPTDRDLRTALNDGIAAWAAAVAQIRAWFTASATSCLHPRGQSSTCWLNVCSDPKPWRGPPASSLPAGRAIPTPRRTPQVTVTRTELASHVEAAFAAGPATRDVLLAYAAGSHARPEVIAVLHDLPDTPYPTMRDLWRDLSHVPIGG